MSEANEALAKAERAKHLDQQAKRWRQAQRLASASPLGVAGGRRRRVEAAADRRQETWQVCQDAAYEIAEFPEDGAAPEVNNHIIATAKRVCLCFEQQMLADDTRKSPRTARRILAKVLTEAGL